MSDVTAFLRDDEAESADPLNARSVLAGLRAAWRVDVGRAAEASEASGIHGTSTNEACAPARTVRSRGTFMARAVRPWPIPQWWPGWGLRGMSQTRPQQAKVAAATTVRLSAAPPEVWK